MLILPENVKVFLAVGATDMRKSFDTLAALVRSQIQEDPLSGHLFVICNRRRDRLKILFLGKQRFLNLRQATRARHVCLAEHGRREGAVYSRATRAAARRS